MLCINCDGQVIKAADDCALQYMNFMNVIFAAQKQVKMYLFLYFLTLGSKSFLSVMFFFLINKKKKHLLENRTS